MDSYKKKIQSPRRAFEWNIEDFNKMEVSLVKFDDWADRINNHDFTSYYLILIVEFMENTDDLTKSHFC